MRMAWSVFFSLVSIAALAKLTDAQRVAPRRDKPLVFTEAIPLEEAKGRFDHFALGRGVLFISALGSNAVEVINIGGRILDHTITGVPDPQGLAFSPDANKLFVASGRGKVYVYDGKSYDLITTVDFEGGADNLRYDAASKRVYVGCGDYEKTGAIAMMGRRAARSGLRPSESAESSRHRRAGAAVPRRR